MKYVRKPNRPPIAASKKGAPARSEAEGRRGCRGKAPMGGGACGRRGRSGGALARRGRRSLRPEGAERSSAERRKRRSRGRLARPGRRPSEHGSCGAENPQAWGGAPPSTSAPERRTRRPGAERPWGPGRQKYSARRATTYRRSRGGKKEGLKVPRETSVKRCKSMT